MKLIYAKLWLKKYIRYNHNKYDKKTLKSKVYGSIVNLSHRVYKSHGLHGHNVRQKIRRQLLEYSILEMNRYYLPTPRPSMISKIINYLRRVIIGK